LKRTRLALVLIVVATACGGSGSTTTLGPAGVSTTTTTSADVTTTTADSGTTTTEVPPVGEGEEVAGDCQELWPENRVQALTSVEYTFFAANLDFTACTYLGGASAIALAWRTGDRADFEASRTGAAATGAVDTDVCDAGFLMALPDAVLIMEGWSEAQTRVYTATISGLGSDLAAEWATALIGSVC
jgi:hypothetical protein